MFGPEFFERAMIAGPVIIFSLSVHEFFHAWSALKFGDDTAARLGRLTINPLAHLDLMGSIVMVMSQFTFGWAKPVPVNLMNVKDIRKADFWISFAGPLSNIGIAIILSLVYKTLNGAGMLSYDGYFTLALQWGVQINIFLAFFNMIPLFPLDGSHMLRSIMPREYQEPIMRFERIAPMILLGLIILPNFIPGFPGIFSIIGPIVFPIISFLL